MQNHPGEDFVQSARVKRWSEPFRLGPQRMNATSHSLWTDAPSAIAGSRETESRFTVYLGLGGLACLPIGLLWDISHHSTIGRDTFWTPAHIVIQLGGI